MIPENLNEAESSNGTAACAVSRAVPCSRLVEDVRRYNAWRRGDESLEMPEPKRIGQSLDAICDRVEELEAKYRMHHAEAERLTQVVRAATVLIAAKGRHNTMLAYQGLRAALSPENASGETRGQPSATPPTIQSP
jgi:hypothetical protein